MKCLFVYNPVSGRGRTGKRLSKIVRALRERYGDVCVAATSERGDMTRIVRASAPLFDAIVFSGGDGTFNEALQGVCESGCSPELGYIPSGTVNDVAHSLGIPKRLRGALRVIRTGRPAALDCMKINDRYAMYIVAAGAFTSAPYTTPQSLKKQMGFIAYGIEGLKKNLRFDVFGVTLSDGRRTVRTDSVFVVLMNGRYVLRFLVGGVLDSYTEWLKTRRLTPFSSVMYHCSPMVRAGLDILSKIIRDPLPTVR